MHVAADPRCTPRPPRRRRRRLRVAACGLGGVVATALLVAPAPGVLAAKTARPGVPDTAPVDLATPVDLADGTPDRSAIVTAGDARIEVLSPTLLRLEYSPSRHFENAPTVNALDRKMPVPRYRSSVHNGWLSVRTTRTTLRYKVGSGPFTEANTKVSFTDGGHSSTVHPTWEWECTFDQVCQAGAATLAGGAAISQTTHGYDSSAGYVGYLLHPGEGATWQVLGTPGGEATLTVRYATFPVLSQVVRAVDVVVNGQRAGAITAPPTLPTTTWTTVSTTVHLHAGTDTVGVRCDTGEGCELNVDTVSLAPIGSPTPTQPTTGVLGGWIRGFDTATYSTTPQCSVPGATPATCQAGLEPLHTDVLLDRAGWKLLDDTHTSVWTATGWVAPRPAHGDVEDGYLFAYGHDYDQALETFARLTGPPPLPDRNVFGVWYSDYTPYSSSVIEGSLYPGFVDHGVPLNTLSLDTDWKAPNDWDGWEWNATLFPDAGAFLTWARHNHLDVTLNIHSSIADDDPQLPTAERVAGGTLAGSTCTTGPCKVWDWSDPSQAESNFDVQEPLEHDGVTFFWVDWCCDASTVSTPGLTPDGWVDHLYAQQLTDAGQRGFVLARIGASEENPEAVYAAGPWSNHTSTIAFTGDAWATWNTLAREAELTPDEASIGEPYVSDDIGSFLGPPPSQAGLDPPDIYDRWVQLGTFQPILRLHSNNEARLPWEYPQPVQSDTELFLRLREALLPYTYTLAADAHATGLPMTQPLYLDFPTQPDAYANPTEYLYGPDVLVAPVTTPGSVASTTVWFPPGRWTDFFTGATFTGPTTATLSVPLDRMPVFVRAGGIVPEQRTTPGGGSAPSNGLIIGVYPGASGSFDLYGDAGSGLGYTKGQATETPITTTTTPSHGSASAVTVSIGPTTGSFPGEPRRLDDEVELVDLSRPTTVSVDGAVLPARAGESAGGAPGWSYDPSTDTLTVALGSVRPSHALDVVVHGARALERTEPTVTPPGTP